ncbi:MAG: exodeoxyribonuclease VII small subunit [Candidatus Doudnabacteria bacterium]|nr:exodeoxyribonuclease VII small subunit [Candidatus Doudnabacteria bacterium]
MPTEKNKLQTALKQLETIVDDLSNKDVDVESGLEKFRSGVDLIKYCRTELNKAENEFQKLKTELETEETLQDENPV